MLHLSFTQQLCHVEKIKHGDAANDAAFELSDNERHKQAQVMATEAKKVPNQNAQNDAPSAPYSALRQIAQRYLIDKL